MREDTPSNLHSFHFFKSAKRIIPSHFYFIFSLHGMKIPVVRGVYSLSHHKKKQIENCISLKNEIIEIEVATEAYESASDFIETNSKGLPDYYKTIDLYERSPSLTNILPDSEISDSEMSSNNSEMSFSNNSPGTNEMVIANCGTKIFNDKNKSVVFTGRKVTVKIQDNSPASYRSIFVRPCIFCRHLKQNCTPDCTWSIRYKTFFG